MKQLRRLIGLWIFAAVLSAQTRYELLLKGGHVIDPANNIDGVMDVAIASGRIARVASNIAEADAQRIVDVRGLYITPGLVDIHVHAYAGTGMKGAYSGDNSVYPGWIHAPLRGDHCGRCGEFGMEELRGFQRPRDRSLENQDICHAEHR